MYGNETPEACHCEERKVGQASRLSMTGKPAPDPDPGMPVPPAISSSSRWRLLRCARNDISGADGIRS